MRLDVTIESTQIGHNIVQMAVVMLDKRTLLAIINLHIHINIMAINGVIVNNR